MNMASRIKLRMSELQLTQEEVAIRAGISQGMVNKLTSGKAKSTSKLIELSKALECGVEWLATGTTESREDSATYNKEIRLSIKQIKEQLALLPEHAQKAIALELMESLIDRKADQ